MWHVLNREGGYDEWPDVAVGVTHSLAQLEVIDKVHLPETTGDLRRRGDLCI
jgi:hypothetical protein